jgi:exoribonuclease R
MMIVGGENEEGPVFGKVVGIIRRNWRQYAGAVVPLTTPSKHSARESEGVVSAEDASEQTVALFVPVDPKIPRVKISTRYGMASNDMLTYGVLCDVPCGGL